MNTDKLDQKFQNLSNALSEFDDALTDTQMNSVPSPNMADISRWRLLAEIDSDVSGLDKGVIGIGEKIEQIKNFNGMP